MMTKTQILNDQPKAGQPGHLNDFHRYSFLCYLLQMLADGDGFKYKIERNGNLVKIWMYKNATGEQEFAQLLFDGDEVKVADEIRRVIRQIVFFTA